MENEELPSGENAYVVVLENIRQISKSTSMINVSDIIPAVVRRVSGSSYNLNSVPHFSCLA